MLALTTTRVQTSIALLTLIFAVLAIRLSGQSRTIWTLPLDSTKGLETINGKTEIASYRGRPALKLVPAPDPAASLALPFGSRITLRATKISTCGPPTAAPKTNCAAIIPSSTSRFQTSPGSACGRKIREPTSPMPTWKLEPGPN